MSANTFTCSWGCSMPKTLFTYVDTWDAKQQEAARLKIVLCNAELTFCRARISYTKSHVIKEVLQKNLRILIV